MEKIFLLGVGGQKCGTTWLHNYLNKHPQTDMGPMKEYHVWDRLLVEEHFDNNELILRKTSQKLNNHFKSINNYKSLDLYNFPDSYFDFFNLLYNDSLNTRLVGDITPAYSMLNTDDFFRIKKGLESKGFTVKVVFLLRDPVERIWSQVRMKRRNLINKFGINYKHDITEEEQVLAWYTDVRCLKRTQYQSTIMALDSTFGKGNLYIGFYESFFETQNIKSLCHFLNIDFKTPDFDLRVNASPKNLHLSIDTQKLIANFYKETYCYVESNFGYDTVYNLWSSYKLL
ncbi:MAG: hypothetical protein ACI9LM_005564 [Alteromonadaceae bacterium]|jgi:hypothetical protein